MPGLTPTKLLSHLAAYDPKPTDYFRHGAERIATTVRLLPSGSGRVLELGCDSHFTLALSEFTNYEVVPQNCPRPFCAAEVAQAETVFQHAKTGERRFPRAVFDVERDPFPFADGYFAGVVCCELIEHLVYDPAWMLSESWRVLAPGGWLFLTTPNLTSFHAIRRAVQGVHPMELSSYFHQERYPGLPVQHTREYAFWDLFTLVKACGFDVEGKWTFTFGPKERLGWLDWLILVPAFTLYNALRLRHPKHLLPRFRHPHAFVLARKTSRKPERFPEPIYYQ